MSELSQLSTIDIASLLSGDEVIKQTFINFLNDISSIVDVLEGSGAPTIQAPKHSWYFDTATSKYYRNTDGGTTWVALN